MTLHISLSPWLKTALLCQKDSVTLTLVRAPLSMLVMTHQAQPHRPPLASLIRCGDYIFVGLFLSLKQCWKTWSLCQGSATPT